MQINFQLLYVLSLLVWLCLFVTGKLQYDRLRKRTMELAVEKAEALLRTDRNLTVERCYELLLPEWEEMLKRTTWFVPHKMELWPVPARPEYVRKRLNLSPFWLGAYLRLHGFSLPAESDLQAEIDQVVARASAPRSGPGSVRKP